MKFLALPEAPGRMSASVENAPQYNNSNNKNNNILFSFFRGMVDHTVGAIAVLWCFLSLLACVCTSWELFFLYPQSAHAGSGKHRPHKKVSVTLENAHNSVAKCSSMHATSDCSRC